MNKKELLDKVKSIEGLSSEEKPYLINLENTNKIENSHDATGWSSFDSIKF